MGDSTRLVQGGCVMTELDEACPVCHHRHLDYIDEENCVSCGCGPKTVIAYLAAARREPAVGALRDTATSIQACVEGAVYRDDATVDVDVSVLINWRDNILDYLAAARREPAVDTSRADSWPHHNQMDATGAEKLKRVAGMMDTEPTLPEVEHVCGLSGFGHELSDECPACTAMFERWEKERAERRAEGEG
jgi:hypothetical protein